MRITTVSSGLTTTQALISAARPARLRRGAGRERHVEADDQAAGRGGGAAEEAAAARSVRMSLACAASARSRSRLAARRRLIAARTRL